MEPSDNRFEELLTLATDMAERHLSAHGISHIGPRSTAFCSAVLTGVPVTRGAKVNQRGNSYDHKTNIDMLSSMQPVDIQAGISPAVF